MQERAKSSKKRSLKEGPVIYHPEDYLIEEHRTKKNLTLSELNQVFKLYLQERQFNRNDISILGQCSLIFNDPMFSVWHTKSKAEQSESLSELVKIPELFENMINSIGATAGDTTIIKGILKDAYQNAIDSFSHAAFLQKKYLNRFPGIKIILFVDQRKKIMVLTMVDNGYGEHFLKPKKMHTGQEYGDDFVSRIVDWIIRRYVEKDSGEVQREIAYTGGQGLGIKKIKQELKLDVNVHFLVSGAVFETRLRNYF